ncbi:MAG TPA: DMT family transporter [Burkholderiales bacterium]|nr:DMT family transporter [Burkholderiales bacterium]
MAHGVGMALAAMVFYGLADWLYKHAAARGVQAHHFLMLQAFFFAPGIFLYGLITRTITLGTPFVWGMAAGLLLFVALYNFARSLASGAVSIVAPVFRLSFALTAALAIWTLDEPVTQWKIAGLLASLAAVWLLLGGGAASASTVSASAVVRVVVAMITMSVVSLIYKIGVMTGGSPATVMTGQASVFVSLATGFAVARDRGFRPPQGAWRYGAAAAVLLLFAQVFLLAGLKSGQASVLVPVAQLSFVVTSALGFFFMRERLTVRKACGLAFAVAALLCLAHS